MSRGVADPERLTSDIMDTTPNNQEAMDLLRRLTSANHLNAILEKAGVLGDLHVQDVSIVSDHPTLVSRIIRLRLTYDGPANALPGSLIVKTGHPERARGRSVARKSPSTVTWLRLFQPDSCRAVSRRIMPTPRPPGISFLKT